MEQGQQQRVLQCYVFYLADEQLARILLGENGDSIDLGGTMRSLEFRIET